MQIDKYFLCKITTEFPFDDDDNDNDNNDDDDDDDMDDDDDDYLYQVQVFLSQPDIGDTLKRKICCLFTVLVFLF